MAYLDNSTITLDAVLTKRGRDLMARGKENFKITQFAFSDDEIDYSLWDSTHPSGSDGFGNIIENTPVLEALTDETQSMKYKLISIPNITNTLTRVYLPIIIINNGSITENSTHRLITLNSAESSVTITPKTTLTIPGTSTTDYGLDSAKGYTFTIGATPETLLNTNGLFTDISAQIITDIDKSKQDSSSIIRQGRELKVSCRRRESDFTDISIPITITGNESGAVFDFILSIVNTDNSSASGVSAS